MALLTVPLFGIRSRPPLPGKGPTPPMGDSKTVTGVLNELLNQSLYTM